MSEESIPNPHDQLFKEAFSHTENAVGFFQNYLPSDLSGRLDWDTLKLQPGKYTDEALRGTESDLLYTVQIDQSPTLLYCLFEHQSTPDAWLPLRLLRYILGIWDQYRKQNPAARMLPPVLPLVLFQGGATWSADLSLSGLIDIPDGLAKYQPEFRHLLVDLNHINADELKGSVIIRTVLLALKASREGQHPEFPRLFQLLAELADKNSALPILRTVLKYICVVDNDADLTEYMRQVEAVRKPKLQEEAMTIAEQLITKGRQEGHQEGRQEGRQEEAAKTLLKIINKRFGSVSPSVTKKISTAGSSQLEAWIDASLDAASVDAVFNG